MKNQEFITKPEVAKLLRVSLGTVNNYVKRGYLKPLGMGSRVLFNRKEIVDSINNSK